MAKQNLHGSQTTRARVDPRHIGSTQAMGAAGRATQTDALDPVTYQPGILSCADVPAFVDAVREDEILQASPQ